MKDIDFEELDRAVNSLMEEKLQEEAAEAAAPATPVAEPAPAVQAAPVVEPVPAVAPPVTTPSVSSESAPAVSSTPAADPVPLPPPAPIVASRKATGRYMDMVGSAAPAPTLQSHREAAVSRAADRNARLSGPTISDITPSASTPSESKADPVVESTKGPVEESVAEQASVPTVEFPAVEEPSTMPDPIDAMPVEETTPEAEAAASSSESAPDKSRTLDTEMQAKLEEALGISTLEEVAPPVETTSAKEVVEEPAPMTSPFIPDAQVEKRPLGQGNPDLKLADTPEPEDVAVVAEAEAEAEDAARAEESLPAELHQEILAVESDSGSTAAQQEQQSAEPEATLKTPKMADSIPQKPATSPDMAAQDHTPLYDTNVQPLTHPAKKKSGWGVVILIILLILLGVGGAVAAYLLKLF